MLFSPYLDDHSAPISSHYSLVAQSVGSCCSLFFFRVTVFISSVVVFAQSVRTTSTLLSYSLLGWKTTETQSYQLSYVRLLLLFLDNFHFPSTILTTGEPVEQRWNTTITLVELFFLTHLLILNFWNRFSNLIETIQRQMWSQIDLGFNRSQSYWFNLCVFPRLTVLHYQPNNRFHQSIISH